MFILDINSITTSDVAILANDRKLNPVMSKEVINPISMTLTAPGVFIIPGVQEEQYGFMISTGQINVTFHHNDKNLASEITSDIIDRMFYELANNWKNETKGFSLAASKINNQNYMTIIGLGTVYPDKITKLILTDLQNAPSYWHYALKKITHKNPVPKELNANIEKTREIWLKWGLENSKL